MAAIISNCRSQLLRALRTTGGSSASVRKFCRSCPKMGEKDSPRQHINSDLVVQMFLNKIKKSQSSPDSQSPHYDRAIQYLNSAASTCHLQTMVSKSKDVTDLTRIPSEIFAPAIVYDLISDLPGITPITTGNVLGLIEGHKNEAGLFNFFAKPFFSDDVDVISVCLWSLLKSQKIQEKDARCAAKLMTLNVTPDKNVIQTYVPPFRAGLKEVFENTDAVVMSNVLRILHLLKMEHLALETIDYVTDWLQNDEQFNQGTNYYQSPDSLLYFLSNSVAISENAKLKFGGILRKRLEERLGATEKPMEVSKRILTAFNLGNVQKSPGLDKLQKEREVLLNLQQVDGSWPLDIFYRLHSIDFYNQTVITAFAAKAIHVSNSIGK